MELENLKIALEERVRSVPAENNLLAPGARSVSVLAKIEKSIRWEIGFAAAFLLFFVVNIFLIEGLFLKAFLGILVIYTLTFLFQLKRIYRQSKKATDSTRPIKICIEETISVVSDFMLLYERLTAWFLPLVFLAAMGAACISEFSKSGALTEFPFYTVLLSLPLIAGWIWLMQRFSKWWLNRLYGRYLEMLFSQLKELTGDDRYTYI